jgi:hypothetical protein
MALPLRSRCIRGIRVEAKAEHRSGTDDRPIQAIAEALRDRYQASRLVLGWIAR